MFINKLQPWPTVLENAQKHETTTVMNKCLQRGQTRFLTPILVENYSENRLSYVFSENIEVLPIYDYISQISNFRAKEPFFMVVNIDVDWLILIKDQSFSEVYR